MNHRIQLPNVAPGTILGALALVVAAAGSFGPFGGADEATDAAPSAGTTAFKKNIRYVEQEHSLPAGGVEAFVTKCPPNHHVISGGHFATKPFLTVPHSYPNKARDAWVVAVANPFGAPQVASKVWVFAICAKVGLPVVP